MHVNAMQPNLRIWELSGFFPMHYSKAVELGRAWDGCPFLMLTDVDTGPAKSLFSIQACFIIDRTMYSTVQLHISNMPFCCGEYGADTFLMIPACAKYSRNYS